MWPIALVLLLAVSTVTCQTCTANGRIASTAVTDCSAYILCVYNSTSGTYVQYNYVCPGSSLFNPTTAVCTTSYTCTSTTTTTDTTTTATTGNCVAAGRIPNPAVTDCSSYILCVLNGTVFIEYTYSCPSTSLFNPNTALCTTSYTCTTTTTTTTTSATTTGNCVAAGRIPNPAVTDCSSYILCVLNGTVYIEYTYSCPDTSLFNPDTAVCSTSYTCTTTTSATTTTTAATTTTTAATTTVASATCTAEGYIADPSSSDCTSYIVCTGDGDGGYTQTVESCPSGTYYDPDTTLCETDYVC